MPFGANDRRMSDFADASALPAPALPTPVAPSTAAFGQNDLRMADIGKSEGADKPGAVGEFVTGKSKLEFPDMPNIDKLNTPFLDVPSWKAAAGMLAAIDTDQKVQVLKKSFPDAKFSEDKFQNPIMEAYGQKVYISKPGLRAQDVIQMGGQASAFVKISKLLGATSGLLKASPVIRAGLASVAGSAGTDIAAHTLGAEKVVDAGRAALAGAFGLGSELLLPTAGSAAWRKLHKVFSGRKSTVLTPSGELTVLGKKALEEADISTVGVPEALAKHFDQVSKIAANPKDAGAMKEAARLAQSQSLPTPVPETRGSLSLSPSAQMFETTARQGAYGKAAEKTMTESRRGQTEALNKNIEAIRSSLGVGATSRNEGGAAVQKELGEALGRTKQATDAAYGVARANPALVANTKLVPFAADVAKSIEDYGVSVVTAREQVDKLSGLALGKREAITVNELFDWRSAVSKLNSTAANRQEGAALKSMLTAFDKNISATIKDALLSGDEKAAKQWLRAVAIRRGEGARFQGNDLIEDILETERWGRGTRLKIAPEAVSNFIFGASDAGIIGKPHLARELGRLQARLGPQSSGWKSLKEESFIRLAGVTDEGAGLSFSPAKFKTNWGKAWNNNNETMSVLFTPPERRLITDFADVAHRVMVPGAGGSNPSGTALALSGMMQRLSGAAFMGPALSVLLKPMQDMAAGLRHGVRASAAVKQPLALRSIPPGATGAAVGAATTVMQNRE